MINFVCKNCGHTKYKLAERTSGTVIATGLYCTKCGQWHKWVSKKEKHLYEANAEEIDKVLGPLAPQTMGTTPEELDRQIKEGEQILASLRLLRDMLKAQKEDKDENNSPPWD